MKLAVVLLAMLCLLVAAAAFIVWSGIYNVAADVPHSKATEWFMETVRERSISTRSKKIVIPISADPKLIRVGFRHYHAM